MDASASNNTKVNTDEVGNTAAVCTKPYSNDPSVISFVFSIGRSYGGLTQDEQILKNFVSQFGSAFSSNDKNAPTYSLRISQHFFQIGNFRILQDCFVQCGNGLVELEITVGTGSHLPSVLPKFAFPSLKKLQCPAAWEKFSTPETQKIIINTATLLKNIVEGSSSLEELTLNNEVGCAFFGLDNILLPSSLKKLWTHVPSITDLENLAKNPLPELSSLNLTIAKTPVPEDFLLNLLSKWRKYLKKLWLDFIRMPGKPPVKICFPVMEKLELLNICVNGGHDFELNQEDDCDMVLDLGLSFPTLKRLVLGLTESRYQQWCEKSVYHSVKEHAIFIHSNQTAGQFPVNLHSIQLTSLAFPNLTLLNTCILGTETSVLQHIFKEMIQLRRLTLHVVGTESIKTSNFWDALLIGTTPETVEKLKCDLDDQDIATFLENSKLPSVRCLTRLTSLSLFTSEPKNEERLISEISYTYAFSRMQKLTYVSTNGRFKEPPVQVIKATDSKYRYNCSTYQILAYCERLLSKCEISSVPNVLRQTDAPRYQFNFLLCSKYSDNAARGTHNSQILENFVSEFGPAFSSNKKDLPTYSLQITSWSLEFRNFTILQNCFVQCGNGLVDLTIQLTLDSVFPDALPKFDFPNLKKLKFYLPYVYYTSPEQKHLESCLPNIKILIQNLLEGSSSLEHLTLENPVGLDIYGLDNIILPSSLTKLEARVCSIKDLEILAKNPLPKLSYISLNIINPPVPEDFLYDMLSNWSESLIRICLDFSAWQLMDPIKMRFPFMEKLNTLSFGSSSGINDFELSQGNDGLEFCFPGLKCLTLRLIESAFQQWCVKSVFWFVETLQINLFGNQQFEHVPVNLQSIQLISLAFPNLTSLTIHIEENETSVLQHVFKKMIQLTKLNLFVHGTESIETSNFWDALLIGTTIETIEELMKKLSLEDQQNTAILENTNTPSIRCLTNLTSLSLFKGQNSEPEFGEPLLSEISFVNAFFRMPELRNLLFSGRFKIPDEMHESLKPKMGPNLEIFNY